MRKVSGDEWANFASSYRGYHRDGKRGDCETMEQVDPTGEVISIVVYHPCGLKEYEIYPERALDQFKVNLGKGR